MPITTSNLIRLAGLSALVAGICYLLVGVFHPLNIPASVTTPQWVIVHILAMAMSFFGLIGMAGLYARQAEKSGWLGLAGYLVFSLWLALILGFTFVEVFILPVLATVAPTFVAGWLGMFTGTASEIDLGALPIVWTISGPIYILGGLLFGIATFRARILSRWAAGLLAVGSVLSPMAVLLPGLFVIPIVVPMHFLHHPKIDFPGAESTAWASPKQQPSRGTAVYNPPSRSTALH